MSLTTDIADAVVVQLNGAPQGTFSQVLSAQRVYLPETNLEELSDSSTSIVVVPRSVEASIAGRNLVQSDVSIDIGIQKKLSTEDNAELDALSQLVDQIGSFIRFRRLTAFPVASWVRLVNDPIYVVEHLRQYRQFTNVLTVTYRVVEACR